MTYALHNDDCLAWLAAAKRNSIHAVVTDPPYGPNEFSEKERRILHGGKKGGVWRIPPKFDGNERDPLPRFTILSDTEKQNLRKFMHAWGDALLPVLVPGAHVCVAGNPSLQYLVQSAMADAGFEVRSAIIRLYIGLRGGDRPKLAEKEFPEVCVTPRGHYEPWMLFRKPLAERTVAENLRRWGTGGLRRLAGEKALPDVIQSARTPEAESALSSHPTMKPQHLMRILVRAMLPLGEGAILDPFAGSGSTIAAAEAVGYDSVGIELDPTYFAEAEKLIPLLAKTYPGLIGDSLEQASMLVEPSKMPRPCLLGPPFAHRWQDRRCRTGLIALTCKPSREPWNSHSASRALREQGAVRIIVTTLSIKYPHHANEHPQAKGAFGRIRATGSSRRKGDHQPPR
jgi:DNA modification methylase